MKDILEDQLDAAYDRAVTGTSSTAEIGAVADFVDVARRALLSSDCSADSRRKVYEYFHYLLSGSNEANTAWALLKSWASAIADDSDRIEIAISIWTPWPDDPLSWLPLS